MSEEYLEQEVVESQDAASREDDLPSAGGPSPQEAEAKLYGWNPNYEGPGKKSAEEFLEEGKRINGFLRKDLDKLRAEISKRDATVSEMRQTLQEFAEFHKETERKAYERARNELKEERKLALREGDGEKVVEIEERMEQLEEVKPQTKQQAVPASPTADPVWQGWVAENKWFADSAKLRAVSNAYGDMLRNESPELTGRPFLDEVKRRVMADFPESFSNEERRRPSAVGGAGESRGGASGSKSYAALPAEAKAACDKFVKQGMLTREQYVKEYFGE